jgi:hypothetical protein
MPTYQIVSSDTIKDDSGRFIPIDPLNADYQDYLAWVAAGNTATNFSPPSNTDTIYIYGNSSVGNSEVYDGTNGSFLYDNNGVLGERATTGSSTVVLSQGATITNATINTPTITGNLYVGSTPYQGDANSVLTATGTGVEWNFSSGIGDVVRNITPTITDLELVGTLTADSGVGTSGQVLTSTGSGVEWSSTATLPMLADGRLTLSSNTPVVEPNASSATTLYYTPYLGNRITLYNGTVWAIYTFTERSIAVPATSNTNYDVFIYDNSGTLTLDLTAWTNDTTRATALTTQDGVLVKTGATTRRYIGTVRTDPTSGRISDTPDQRHVWNMYNRVAAHFYAGTTGTYTYTTATWRAAGGITTLGLSRVQWVCGQNTHIQLTNYSMAYNTSSLYVAAGIGIDQTAGNDAQIRGGGITASNQPNSMTAFYDSIVTPGYHYGQRVEISQATGTTTWYSAVATNQLGMRGVIFC